MKLKVLGFVLFIVVTGIAFKPNKVAVLDAAYTSTITALGSEDTHVHAPLADSYREISLQLSEIATEHGVNINLAPTTAHSEKISYSLLSQDDTASLQAYFPLFEVEFAKYSTSKLEQIGVRNIFLVKNLQLQMQGRTDYVSGAADYATNSIFIDITTSQRTNNGHVTYQLDGCEPTQFARGILHHELWHIYERNNPNKIASEPDKHYGQSANSTRSYDLCIKEGAEFVSDYARTNPLEDRAEQYRAEMTLAPY